MVYMIWIALRIASCSTHVYCNFHLIPEKLWIPKTPFPFPSSKVGINRWKPLPPRSRSHIYPLQIYPLATTIYIYICTFFSFVLIFVHFPRHFCKFTYKLLYGRARWGNVKSLPISTVIFLIEFFISFS